MNKMLKVLAASALVATALVGCGKTETPDTAAKYAKVGLGVVSSVKNEVQVNTTFAAVALDADGKIAYVSIDVAQTNPADEEKAKTESKKDLGDAYGMKGTSGIGKEWNEQIAALEEYMVGKTAEEVAGITVDESNVPTGEDLTSTVTIKIGDYQAAVAKAIENAVEVSAEKVSVGHVMANNAEKGQANTTIAVVATDADGKIVKSIIDVAQIAIASDDMRTKLEKGADYGMAGASPIGKEWNEQITSLTEYMVGKTAADVAGIEVSDTKVPTSEDLTSTVTIKIGDYQTAVANALK